MNITQTPKSDLTATIQINIVEADYAQDVTNELKNYQKKASMPGFRPGKVPFGMIKKMYGKSVIAEKVNDAISNALQNYIVENKLNIIGQPLSDDEKNSDINFENNVDFDFYFEIGLIPEINIDLSKVKTTYYKLTVSKETIEDTLKKIAEGNPTHTNPETVGENDKLDLKVHQIDKEGKEIEGGFEKKIHIHIDQIKEKTIKNDLIGKEIGSEFLLNLSKALGSDDAAEKVLGLTDTQKELASADFNTIIDEIHRDEPAELNEDFFKRVFPTDDIKDLDTFKKRIGDELEKNYQNESDRFFFNKAIDAIIDANTFAIPDEFLKRWIVEANEGKITQEDVTENYDKFYSRSFRWQLIEQDLLKNNPDLAVKQEEIREQFRKYFSPMIMNSESVDEEMNKRLEGIVDNMMQNQEQRNRIANQIAEQKMTTFLKSNLKIKEKQLTYDEFVKEISKEQEK
ncbi:MAG: trigger factor [Lentimicrobiaceae bacterium]|jgi:trigger factor|nr:trigger factor [Lentimicrobiaceae bacterium]